MPNVLNIYITYIHIYIYIYICTIEQLAGANIANKRYLPIGPLSKHVFGGHGLEWSRASTNWSIANLIEIVKSHGLNQVNRGWGGRGTTYILQLQIHQHRLLDHVLQSGQRGLLQINAISEYLWKICFFMVCLKWLLVEVVFIVLYHLFHIYHIDGMMRFGRFAINLEKDLGI